MTITSYGSGAYRSARTDTFVSSRNELEDLQRQLATKKRSETYGGLDFGEFPSQGMTPLFTLLHARQSVTGAVGLSHHLCQN